MKIEFGTKDENNKRREDAFLALSGAERFFQFLRLQEQVHFFPVKNRRAEKNNFLIVIPDQNELGK